MSSTANKQRCGCPFTSVLFILQFGLLCSSLARRPNDSSSLEASMLKKTWGKEKHQLIAQFKIFWDGLLWFWIGGKLSLTTIFFLPTWMQTWMQQTMGGKFFFCADILNRLSYPPDTRQQIVLCWLQPLQKYQVLQKEATICSTKQVKLSYRWLIICMTICLHTESNPAKLTGKLAWGEIKVTACHLVCFALLPEYCTPYFS